MPAPSTIITFTDADGDEFPIRIQGTAADERGVNYQNDLAHIELKRMADEGRMRPTWPVALTKRETH